MNSILLRPVRESDVSALLSIYSQYIETNITFEYDLPSQEEFLHRIRETTAVYPWLVCEKYGRIVGYAYAHLYKERAAYAWDVELSVYTSREAQGMGIGRRLYGALLALLALQGVYTAYGRVTHPNEKSERLHEVMGFSKVGEEHGTGFKNGVWMDLTVYEKRLSPHDGAPRPITPLSELDPAEVENIMLHYM